MDLTTLQQSQGAQLAPDHIPLHFGDQAAEYDAALHDAVLLDRSHEARLAIYGSSALDILQRISTNDLSDLSVGEGRPTIFTNANARLLDRSAVFRLPDHLLLLGEPGRGQALAAYLQRNIFFGDDARIVDLASVTHAFDLHGPEAATVIEQFNPDAAQCAPWQSAEGKLDSNTFTITRRKPVVDQRWPLVVASEQAAALWAALSEAGARPAGSLTYNILRVRAGLPSIGRELSDHFIPLEIGLWDEVSFSKGCYTGQEIIARMESRSRLAKTMVTLQLDQALEAPAEIYDSQRSIGQLTSCVTAPDGEIFAIGLLKPDYAEAGQSVTIGDDRVPAQVKALAGAQARIS
jgi:folate-binding protein YgfZ